MDSAVGDERETTNEPVDPFRTALLGIWTTIVALAFLAFLVADQASAVTH